MTHAHLAGWNFQRLLIGFMLAALLAASWLWPDGHAAWSALDDRVFYALNGSLADNPNAQIVWAFANTRYGDMLFGLILIMPFLHFIRRGGKDRLLDRCAIGLFMAVYVVITIAIAKALAPYNASPSLVLTPLWNLNTLVPWLEAKVSAGSTFPSDHGITLLLLAIFVWHFAGWRYGMAQLAMALCFCIPRMVSGAHWLSDIAVGSLFTAIIAATVALATPLGGKLIALCRRVLEIPVIARSCRLLLYKTP